MFFYTFHTSDIKCVYYYLNSDHILYCCHHYGFDKNNLEIKGHFHVISSFDIVCDYNEVFTYKNKISIVDFERLRKYCENGHCNFDIIISTEIFESFISSCKSKKNGIDELIEEIVYNSENKIIRSHSYYLKKYGKVYLFNFKRIREMFDFSSAFYDWTDVSNE